MKLSDEPLGDFPVYRTRELPTTSLAGNFLLAAQVLTETQKALQEFALDGIRDGGHEGMVFWAGREVDGDTIFLQAVVPDAEHSYGRVHASKLSVGAAARAARTYNLGILCQVHSHPGGDTRHSDGDDDLVLLPFEGMLSIVVPRFGIGFESLAQAGVHQFQNGRWALCNQASIAHGIKVLPAEVNLRVRAR
jgi:hypothetical protein